MVRVNWILFLSSLLIALALAACALPGSAGAPSSPTGDALRVEEASARPALQGDNSAAYLTVVNPTAQDDRLRAVESTVAQAAELHETVDDGGIMRMTPRPEGFPVPANSELVLEPGGKHIMLVNLAEPLAAETSFPLTLVFAEAGPVAVDVAVMGMGGETDSAAMAMPMVGAMAADALPSQESAAGLFRVTATSRLDPVVLNEIHSWVLHVETAEGEPVEDATITVSGGMPAHNHGLPTAPQVTEYLGEGDYLLEGMRFNMGGLWVLDLEIASGEQSDTVHFEFELE